MANGNLFLYGEDTTDDVRAIRDSALAASHLNSAIEWTTENVSVRKARTVKDVDNLIRECNYFLRLYDPKIKALNPIIKRTKVLKFF